MLTLVLRTTLCLYSIDFCCRTYAEGLSDFNSHYSKDRDSKDHDKEIYNIV